MTILLTLWLVIGLAAVVYGWLYFRRPRPIYKMLEVWVNGFSIPLNSPQLVEVVAGRTIPLRLVYEDRCGVVWEDQLELSVGEKAGMVWLVEGTYISLLIVPGPMRGLLIKETAE